MASTPSVSQPNIQPQKRPSKLPRLPQNARVEKRPLLRPAIPSPYSSADQQKVVYISTKTPFLSAVKRVEKLLQQAEKRLVQSATTQQKISSGKRKRGIDADEIADVAATVEREKVKKAKDGIAEAVAIKGTGKAIDKTLQVALWFQQRDEYGVTVKTGSIRAIDDITVDESVELVKAVALPEDKTKRKKDRKGTTAGAHMEDVDQMDADPAQGKSGQVSQAPAQGPVESDDTAQKGKSAGIETVTETRIRYTSVIEVYVTLK